MANTLILPDRQAPTNMRLKESIKTRFIDSDLYDIAKRLKARHPSIYVLELTDPDNEPGRATWAIMEDCEDGVQRLMYKVAALDQRVLQRLDKIMHLPLLERVAQLEREEYRLEAERKEAELEQLYERVGAPMWGDLERCGFIQRPVSYPTKGVVQPKRHR